MLAVGLMVGIEGNRYHFQYVLSLVVIIFEIQQLSWMRSIAPDDDRICQDRRFYR